MTAGPGADRAILDHLLDALRQLPTSPDRDRYLGFLAEQGTDALRRDGGPEHVTASCFVLCPELDRVLLCYHRKGRFWVQFGGHLEPEDRDVAEAARREAREESGLADLELASPDIVDLDRHDLGPGFACRAHWDLGFVAFASPAAETTVSAESEDVGWFGIAALPPEIPSGFANRLQTVVDRMRHRPV
ncbi:8-oxo-dGTP pyrophosphatase MutT (NUDIX family) [Friedmanniella endophytica]|uniref:8-oxo-dGTP pyrophosphatase MutT (NUDIX family) n=1 Tax=Microlunatus kandeliicorticis TaxID=1759536 RepID=A0A7W3P466_9ACTN|nr:NUDIX domain-containing protein [Microlunatus kandeliicorticis]MBA8792538.1 8-oxo-dGTP pyrophosphatase MutT (NUDIX family) [Microlunatus kandeliicorticis]